MPESGVPQPFGSIGSKLEPSTAGRAMITKVLRAMIFTNTSTAVNLALLEVPITSSQVTNSETRKATRLNEPLVVLPSGSTTGSNGPAVSAYGKPQPTLARKPFA